MNKLTIEDIENFMAPYKDEVSFQGMRLQYDVPHDKVLQIANQLADTMRENERLRELLKWGMKAHSEKKFSDNWYAEAEEYFHYPNKDTSHE